jgi:hypothetical protein
VFDGKGLELGNEPKLSAEREIHIDSLLHGCQAQLLQPLHLDAREGLELEVRERTPVPECLGRAQGLGGRRRFTRCE